MSSFADLPAPPVPADCDLRAYRWMAIDVMRVMDSDTFALSTGEEFKAAFALWCKSWFRIPAGSLPDDPIILAHLSCTGARWSDVAAVALRGWYKCSDGLLYHGTVAEKVNEAWGLKLAQVARTASARAASIASKAGVKANSDNGGSGRKPRTRTARHNGANCVTQSATQSATQPATQSATPPVAKLLQGGVADDTNGQINPENGPKAVANPLISLTSSDPDCVTQCVTDCVGSLRHDKMAQNGVQTPICDAKNEPKTASNLLETNGVCVTQCVTGSTLPYLTSLRSVASKQEVNPRSLRSLTPLKKKTNDPEFAKFYAAYPRHRNHDEAAKAWVKAMRSGTTSAEIMEGLQRHTFHEDPKFIPYPASWLNAGSWKDERDQEVTIKPRQMPFRESRNEYNLRVLEERYAKEAEAEAEAARTIDHESSETWRLN